LNPAKQLIAPKLVLRKVEINNQEHAGTGPKYEHPSKEKLDYSNPIDKIF